MIARKEKELCIKISDKNITITRKIFQFKEFPDRDFAFNFVFL